MPLPDTISSMHVFEKQGAWPKLIMAITAVLVLLSAKFTWPDGDDGRYAVWAIALAQGDGITNIHLPEPTPEVVVPPGLSIALAPVVLLLGPDNFTAMMLFSAVCLILLCPVVLRWLQQEACPPGLWTISACVIGVWGVFTISAAWRIHTEILYMLLSFSALAFWPDRKDQAWKILVPGLLAGAAFMTRTVGLALLPAGMVALLFQRRWTQAVLFALAFTAVNLPLVLRSVALAGTPVGYTQSSGIHNLADQLKTVSVFIPHYLFYGLPDLMFYRLISPDGLFSKLHLPFLATPTAILIGTLIAIGFFCRVFRFGVTDLYWGAYFLIISSFNQPDYAARGEYLFQDRYVIPIIPIAALYISRSLSLLSNQGAATFGKRIGQSVIVSLALYVAATATGAAISRFRSEAVFRGMHPMAPARYADLPNSNDRAWGSYFDCAFWLGSNAPPGAVVVCRKPYEVFLASNLASTRYIELGTGERLLNRISQWQNPGVYILEDAFTAETAFGRERNAIVNPLLEDYAENFELLYETGEPTARVWKLRQVGVNPKRDSDNE